MGYLTKAYGYLAALDIVVVAFEAVLVVIAIFMVETQKREVWKDTACHEQEL